jgi:hypothetical protein
LLLAIAPAVLELVISNWEWKKIGHAPTLFLLICCAFAGYFRSQQFGISRAHIDASDKTALSSISFTRDRKHYRGRLLYLKGDMYFIHGAVLARLQRASINLAVFRASEISEVTIVER